MKSTITLIGMVCVLVVVGGCVGYTDYPSARWNMSRDNPNYPPVDEIMAAAVGWTIDHYPPGYGTMAGDNPGEPVAVSLPPNVRRDVFERVVRWASDRAVPATPQTANLATYIVGDIRVRGQRALVDVFRPVREGEGGHQGITVRLDGGLHPWRVVDARVWHVGTLPVPIVHMLPGEGVGGAVVEPEHVEPPSSAEHEVYMAPEIEPIVLPEDGGDLGPDVVEITPDGS